MPSACRAIPTVLLPHPGHALSLIGRMEGSCIVLMALAPSPPSLVLLGFLFPQTERSPVTAQWPDLLPGIALPSDAGIKDCLPKYFC